MVHYEGRPPNDLGGVDCLGVRALHRYYACADGWIGLVAETDAEAQALGQALGVDIGPAPLLAPREGELALRIEATLIDRPRGQVLEALLAAGVAAAPVLRSAESLEDPWLADNGFYEPWVHPRLGPMMTVRGYADFARTPGGLHRPTPEPGEHSAEVLRDYGIAEGRIADLFAAGAVFQWDAQAALAVP